MKRFLFGILVGAVIVLGLIWHYSHSHDHVELIRRDLTHAAQNATQYVEEKLGTTNLSRQEILDELQKTGRVVRRKAEDLGHSIAEATADPRTVAVIKAKLLADQNLASLNISVACNQGNVTLSGTATSPENIKKAVKLALEVDGVNQVTSTLKVKEPGSSK